MNFEWISLSKIVLNIITFEFTRVCVTVLSKECSELQVSLSTSSVSGC